MQISDIERNSFRGQQTLRLSVRHRAEPVPPCIRQIFMKRAYARGCKASRSISVRKSIVLNSRSMAGGPQIFAPTTKYARNSFGILALAPSETIRGIAKLDCGVMRS